MIVQVDGSEIASLVGFPVSRFLGRKPVSKRWHTASRSCKKVVRFSYFEEMKG